MKASKKMAKALLTSGQYRTKKYLYTLGYNMYGQEIVQRTQIDSEATESATHTQQDFSTPMTTRKNGERKMFNITGYRKAAGCLHLPDIRSERPRRCT